MSIRIAIRLDGMRLVNETNARENHFERSRRAKVQREGAKVRAMAALRRAGLFKLPEGARVHIEIVRIGVGRLDDDNLHASGKHVRDGIADALGIDDGSKRLSWDYDQRSEGKGVYAAVVTITVHEASDSVTAAG